MFDLTIGTIKRLKKQGHIHDVIINAENMFNKLVIKVINRWRHNSMDILQILTDVITWWRHIF